MLGATAERRPWNESSVAEPSPALAAAPEGLSARRVERWLDLPPGAWQKRRLYALRLNADSFAKLGCRAGDLVIVEPGSTEQPGRIVVTRSSQGTSLRKIALPREEARMPTVLELPLRDPARVPEHVVGTVLGVLRSTGTGAMRPVPFAGARVRRRTAERPRQAGLPERGVRPSGRSVHSSVEELVEVREKWRRFLADLDPEAAHDGRDRRERLDHSLSTICECLARTHSDNLRSALKEEAEAILTAIRTEMGR
jgi:hypothetical protein